MLFLKEAQACPLVNRHTFGEHSETWNFLQRGIEATEKQQPIDLIEYRGNTWLSLASLDAELKAPFQQEQEVKRELTFRWFILRERATVLGKDPILVKLKDLKPVIPACAGMTRERG